VCSGASGQHERTWYRCTELGEEHVELVVEAVGERGEGATRWGELEVPPVFDIEGRSHPGGELLNLRVKRRLRDVEILGCPREVGVPRKDTERPQGVESDRVANYSC
jgi:hypothetical protein